MKEKNITKENPSSYVLNCSRFHKHRWIF